MDRVPAFRPNRRRVLVAGAAALAASPSVAQDACIPGAPDHVKGPAVWGDYDQVELDAAYDQDAWQAVTDRTNARLGYLSADLRWRRGYPERHIYGEGAKEGLDFYSCGVAGSPAFVFIHGGTWRYLDAAMSGFAAEMFLDAGAHFAALDFDDVRRVGGDLTVLADQVRRGFGWIAGNADALGIDPGRLYLGGHSSGGHLAAVALVTDWTALGLPPDVVRGGLCMSGMYDLAPVFLSARRAYLATAPETEEAMSPQRHLAMLRSPLVVSYGTYETPEFQRQAIDFAAAVEAAGHQVTLVEGVGYHHQEMWESLGNPYGVNGRAALAMMELAA